MVKGTEKMGEKLVGIEAIGKALTGGSSNVETMNHVVAMKRQGYRVETDENGTWEIPAEDIARYLNGGKEPKKVEAPKETDGEKGDPADQGRYKIEHKGRGKWAIVDTETGEQLGDKTYPKKTAESVVKMANEGPGAPVAASIEPE
jgi:hypothetical protein